MERNNNPGKPGTYLEEEQPGGVMPKIYDQNRDPERESKNRNTIGEPDSPEKVQKRNMALVIAAIKRDR